jgi:hypothetical protein
MVRVSASAYKFLGYILWRGLKWDLRRRLPSARGSVAVGVLAFSGLALGTLLVRRLRS